MWEQHSTNLCNGSTMKCRVRLVLISEILKSAAEDISEDLHVCDSRQIKVRDADARLPLGKVICTFCSLSAEI